MDMVKKMAHEEVLIIAEKDKTPIRTLVAQMTMVAVMEEVKEEIENN
jgi:hypothetical protein